MEMESMQGKNVSDSNWLRSFPPQQFLELVWCTCKTGLWDILLQMLPTTPWMPSCLFRLQGDLWNHEEGRGRWVCHFSKSLGLLWFNTFACINWKSWEQKKRTINICENNQLEQYNPAKLCLMCPRPAWKVTSSGKWGRLREEDLKTAKQTTSTLKMIQTLDCTT